MEVSVVVSLVLRFYKKFLADLRFSSVLMKCFIFLSSVYLSINSEIGVAYLVFQLF